MGSRKSVGLRERAVAAADAAPPRSKVSAVFGISVRGLERWFAGSPLRITDRLTPVRSTAQDQRPAREAHLAAHPERTSARRGQRWAEANEAHVGTSTMLRELARFG